MGKFQTKVFFFSGERGWIVKQEKITLIIL